MHVLNCFPCMICLVYNSRNDFICERIFRDFWHKRGSAEPLFLISLPHPVPPSLRRSVPSCCASGRRRQGRLGVFNVTLVAEPVSAKNRTNERASFWWDCGGLDKSIIREIPLQVVNWRGTFLRLLGEDVRLRNLRKKMFCFENLQSEDVLRDNLLSEDV